MAFTIFDAILRKAGSSRLLAPAADDVVALVDLGEELRDLFRRVLEVGVERDDDLAPLTRRARRRSRRAAASCARAR